jgi:ABC-type polysaccharide/polyol phosphate transport system ATPase subunit
MNPNLQKICSKCPEISLINVTKTFSVIRNRKTIVNSIKGVLSGNSNNPKPYSALNDINFEILEGEKIGIVGINGSGKTTLLKTIAGLYKPNDGEVHVNGKMILLAGYGIGMVDELSVKENIYLYGAIYGIDRKALDEELREIIDWAELQDFMDTQLKTLSSGMRTRLGFSVARFMDADIYLLDEALSAGDKNFKQKCDEYFDSTKNEDKTYLVASHNLEFLKMFCNKTLWLHKGNQMAFGETESVLEQYNDSTNIGPKSQN